MDESSQLATDSPFRIGDWQIDPSNNELRKGELTIKLEPKVMDVLVYMAGRPGQVVSREELEDNVWAGRVVTYDALTATVVKLRKAFQTGNDKQTIIKTIPKRGYCLVATVSALAADSNTAQQPSTVMPAAQTTPVTTTTPSVSRKTRLSEPERRPVTVLACDLIDNSLSPDPEAQLELFTRFQRICHEIIQPYGGHIVQTINGQLVIYFGYPAAHEGDAERAIRSALEIITSVQQLSKARAPTDDSMAVRIGIQSGEVVVGETDHDQRDRMSVVGDTPMLAGALKNAAQPNRVYVGESTHRLVGQLFDFVPCAPIPLNESRTTTAFQVENKLPSTNRFAARQREGVTPMVGRESELELMRKRWEQSKTEEAQVVCLCADAGIGKSRILLDLQQHLGAEEKETVLLFCSPFHQHSSLYPVTGYLTDRLGMGSRDASEPCLDKLETLLSQLGLPATECAPVFAELLSLPYKDRYPGFEARPQELKNRIMQNLLRLFGAMAQHKPVLLILEDAHWIDPTTHELIDLLIRELSQQRIFIVTCYRPEFDPPWSGYMQTTLLRLNRLSKSESAALIQNVCQGQDLPANILAQIIARTDGVALFIEELTKSVLSSEAVAPGSLHAISIPESLQDSLMARLDRLRQARPVAQLASVLGRSFSLELMRAVVDEDTPDLDQALDELLAAELLYKRGVPPDIHFEFKHTLVQNAAYQSLLKNTRRQFHKRIAEVLQRQFPQIARTQPEVLAHHFTEAQQPEAAIPYWLQAGQRASEHSANIEAIAHLQKGLELVQSLSRGLQRTESELRLLLVLGPALLSAKGLGARDAEKVYLRARELCRETGDDIELFTVTWGLWLLCQKRGRLQEAQTFASELLALADKLNEDEYHLQANHAAWTTSFRLSDFESCATHARQGLELYNVDTHRHHAMRFGGHDPGVCAFYNTAMSQWLMGNADQARTSVQNAVQLARQINHPFSQVLAHVFSAFVNQCCGDAQTVSTHTQSVLDLCQQHGIAPDCAAQARALAGWVETETGDPAQGLEMIEQGIAALRLTGVRTHEPYLLCVLAEAYACANQIQQGLHTIDEALHTIEETGERTFAAEAYRIKGELLRADAGHATEQALTALQQASELATQQQAQALELRAVMSLYQACEKTKQAPALRQRLQTLYNDLNEGHDTKDLQAAAVLLK